MWCLVVQRVEVAQLFLDVHCTSRERVCLHVGATHSCICVYIVGYTVFVSMHVVAKDGLCGGFRCPLWLEWLHSIRVPLGGYKLFLTRSPSERVWRSCFDVAGILNSAMNKIGFVLTGGTLSVVEVCIRLLI